MSGPLTAKPRSALHALPEFVSSTRTLHDDSRLLFGCKCQTPYTVELCTQTTESTYSLEVDPRRESTLPSSVWVGPPQEAHRAYLAFLCAA